jgi:non-ribosomal peptide synthase protein (TIGR01720 family)
MVMSLDEDNTERLLKEVNQAYHTEINDILLTALAMAVKEWTGMEKILINLEGHGRENIIEDVNISRTVGWFTSQFPVILDVSMSETAEDKLSYTIKGVKETLRAIPNNGMGCGILKYLTPQQKLMEQGLTFNSNREPEISFNYLGQLGQEFADNDAITLSEMSMGESLSPELEMWHAIDINGAVGNGRLRLEFTYNRYEYRQNNIKKLVDSYQSNLEKIIQHCLNKVKTDDTEMTLSDFSSSNLDEQDLETIYEDLAEDF